MIITLYIKAPGACFVTIAVKLYKYKWLAARQKANMPLLNVKGYNWDIIINDSHLDDLKQVLKYSQVNELTQEVVDTFICKIRVFKNKALEIEWTFSFMQLSNEKALLQI